MLRVNQFILSVCIVSFVGRKAIRIEEVTQQVEDRRIDALVCPLHDENLVEAKQKTIGIYRIQYGPGYVRLREELYLYSFSRVMSESDFALVRYCPKCRFAEEKLKDVRPPHPVNFVGSPGGWQNYDAAMDEFIRQQRHELEVEFSTDE